MSEKNNNTTESNSNKVDPRKHPSDGYDEKNPGSPKSEPFEDKTE